MNLPNIITVLRILCVPIVVWLISTGNYFAAFWVFLGAGISDAVDGYLAREWNQRTELGAYLDAIADKALLVSIYIALAMVNTIPAWLTIAVVSRDLMIIGAVLLSWLMDKPVAIAPLKVSKLNTVAQISFAAVVLGGYGYGVMLGNVFIVGTWVVAVLTVASALLYLVEWMRHMSLNAPVEGD